MSRAALRQRGPVRICRRGPCPAWNDENIHHMHFMVYALSVSTLNLGTAFDGAAAMDAMKNKILAQGELLGLYTQNPDKGAKIPK